MSNSTTIARPYAKAIFEHALAANSLSQWSDFLQALAALVSDSEAMQFIANPAATEKQQTELLMILFKKVVGAEVVAIENLVTMLAYNKRLMLLPSIKLLFEALRAEQEKTLIVKIVSFSPLSTAQEQHLISSLTQRLQRQVTLDVSLDELLLGGAIIEAGDLIIDGSVRGKLNKLSTDLAA